MLAKLDPLTQVTMKLVPSGVSARANSNKPKPVYESIHSGSPGVTVPRL
jgi:hypothetical protein